MDNLFMIPTYVRPIPNMLLSGEGQYPGETIASPNGLWRFTFHENGHFELVDQQGRVAWQTSATGDARNAYMDPIGDFTACDMSGRYIWHSGTAVVGSHLAVEDIGRVAIYSEEGKLVWSTERPYAPQRTVLPPLNAIPEEGSCRSPRPPAVASR